MKSLTTNSIETLKWHQIRLKFISNNTLSTSAYTIIDAVIHDIESILNLKKPLFFHIDRKPLKYHTHKNETFTVTLILIEHTEEELIMLMQALTDYFEDSWNSRNFTLIDVLSQEERNLKKLIEQYDYEKLLSQQELCLEFLTPVTFPLSHPKKRAHITKQEFLNLFTRRIERLFNLQIHPSVSLQNIHILPYWRYEELIVPSSSQKGHKRYINGCVGKLYIRGDFTPLLPYLIICSELHGGSQISYARGYYILHQNPVSYLSTYPLVETVQFYVDKNKQFLEGTSSKEMAKQLSEQITEGIYEPQPYQAFSLPETGLLTGKYHWKDMVVQSVLYKILKYPIDNMLPLTVLAFRPHISAQEIENKIMEAYQNGFDKMVTFTLNGLYNAVDHRKLIETINYHIPLADRPIVTLIEKIIKSPYYYEGKIHTPEKGLPPASPLSPLLSNLYLTEVDRMLNNSDAIALRHADTYLIMSDNIETLEEKLSLAEQLLKKLNLTIKKGSVRYSIDENINFAGIKLNFQQKRKTLRKPLYLCKHGNYLNLSEDTVKISNDEGTLQNIPLTRLSEIIIISDTTVTTPFLRKCAENRIPVVISSHFNSPIILFSADEKFHYESIINHTLKYKSLSNETLLMYAKEIVRLKIKAYELLFSMKGKTEKSLRDRLSYFRQKALESSGLDNLRGYEAVASKQIYSAMRELIKNPDFQFTTRRRVNPDYMNSLMNLCSHLIFHRIKTLTVALGLNPYLGFLHSPQNNYESLVADIQELLRARMDNLLLRVVNLKIIQRDDFRHINNGYILKSQALQKFISHFEEYLNTPFGTDGITVNEFIYNQLRNIKLWANSKEEELKFEIPW